MQSELSSIERGTAARTAQKPPGLPGRSLQAIDRPSAYEIAGHRVAVYCEKERLPTNIRSLRTRSSRFELQKLAKELYKMLGAFRSILGRQSPASTIQKLSGQAWRRTFTNSTPSKTIQWRGRKAGFAPASRILQQTRLGNQAKLWRNTQQNLLSRTTRRNFNWSRPRTRKSQASGPGTQVPEQNLSLSARLKKLSREYGWAAVGVYFGLSVLDFPFCFALVRFIGVDRIGTFSPTHVSTTLSEESLS